MPQLEVLFDRFPHLPEFQVRARPDGLRVGAASYDPVAAVLKEGRLPDDATRVTIDAAPWVEPIREKLRAHTAYVVLHCAKGPVIERWIAVYQVALRLLDEGAIGVAASEIWTCFPAEASRLLRQHGIWDSLRDEGVPPELITGFARTDRGFVTRGHAAFGFPDFVCETGETEEVHDLFRNLFLFMYEKDQPIAAGHTADHRGKKVAFEDAGPGLLKVSVAGPQ